MDASDPPEQSLRLALSLPPEEQWTLHHVLLDRIERETTAEQTNADSPPVEVFRAFERLDAGETSFTVAELEAIQAVLAEYHHATTWWELERARLERLLHRVTDLVAQRRTTLPSER
jgi:hypothetical protein